MIPRGKIHQFVIIAFRIQKYERDLKRWEYMEDEHERAQQKINMQKEKY